MAKDLNDLEHVAYIDGIYALIFREDGRILGGVIPDIYDYLPEGEVEMLNVHLAWRMGMIFPLIDIVPADNKKPN